MSKRIAVQIATGVVLLALGGVALSGLFRDRLFGTADPEATSRIDTDPRDGESDAANRSTPRSPVRLASADAPAGGRQPAEKKSDEKKLPATKADDKSSDGKASPPGSPTTAGKNGAPPNGSGVKPADTKAGSQKSTEKSTADKAPSDKSVGDKGGKDKSAPAKSGTTAPAEKTPAGKMPDAAKGGPAAKAAAAPPVKRRDDPIVEDCLVEVINDVRLSAGEAGLLDEINVKEGDAIKPGDVLGSIDKREPELRKQVKTFEYLTAKEEADTDVEWRFANASWEFFLAGHEKKEEANRKSKGTYTDIEMKESELGVKKAKLQIEQSDVKHRVAELAAESKQVEIKAPELSIDQRTFRSRLDGEGKVIEISKRKGEWVSLGEPVFRVIQLDKLRVKGYVDAKEYDRREVVGRPVMVRLETAEGREEFKGKLVFANYVIESGGQYQVFAEIDNRRDAAGDWVLSSGMRATMTIHLK